MTERTKMQSAELNKFIDLIRTQFREEDRSNIHADTDLKTLKEWSSLQTMIIVNEIDKEYKVILGPSDIRNANTVEHLYQIVQSKAN